ncbi:MAG: PIN domain-containing protein [Phycisphaerales bacterium]
MYETCVKGGIMLFDTDVLIWALRGNTKAASAVDEADERCVLIVSYMELLQGTRNKNEMRAIKSFLADAHIAVLSLTENIGHRAAIYMEEYRLSSGLDMADALIAAGAVENHQPLLTANDKHYRAVKELELVRFRP